GAFERHPEWVVVAVAEPEQREGDRGAPGVRPAGLEREFELEQREGNRGTTAPPAAGSDSARVVAFVTYRLDPTTRVGTIGNNAVGPAWQGRGIAGALYRLVLDRFRAAGMAVAAVTTGLDEAHAPARAAYRRVGFTAATPSVTLYQEL
ncbi:MAG: GNAT family N-acetyltransferase, partial [Chloroflexota bacterium]|nr:GNAT family N-acetyltransferase [Chloroflexota bacterium]